jgi:maltooligosyltrehalose trehalohydrolase
VTFVEEANGGREVVLRKTDDGYHAAFIPGIGAGTRYRFRVGDMGPLLADPASRSQPEGPFGPSEIIDPRTFPWTDASWRGLPRDRHVIYELHVGTFTPEGTWLAAARALPYLAAVGITTIEMMPVAECAGHYNWGYDGVNLYAPSHNYGTPDDLRRFVDRAHALGIAVILDVVYNHLGPAGNPLFAWSPLYKHAERGDWGDTLDYSQPAVREYIVENAAYWISEFHFDGLRLDAVQAIIDTSEEHVVAALARRARSASGGREIFLVGEDEPQRAWLLDLGLDALWNDDFHHSARVAATGLADGYLHDFHGAPQELVSALERGFLYQGQIFPWQHNPRGSSTRGHARQRFVHYLENHDQIANVGFGERLGDLTDPATLRALTAVLLLGPEVPLLFQGQETGARQPWHFFVDLPSDLHTPVREGRAEFVSQFENAATPETRALLRDPNDPATFRACILDPTARRLDAPMVQLHRDLLRIRRDDRAFTDAHPDALAGAVLSHHAFCVRFFQDPPINDRLLLVNLGPTLSRRHPPEPLLGPVEDMGWRVVWSSEDPRYGGHGTPTPFTRERLWLPARSAVLLVPDRDAALVQDPTLKNGNV